MVGVEQEGAVTTYTATLARLWMARAPVSPCVTPTPLAPPRPCTPHRPPPACPLCVITLALPQPLRAAARQQAVTVVRAVMLPAVTILPATAVTLAAAKVTRPVWGAEAAVGGPTMQGALVELTAHPALPTATLLPLATLAITLPPLTPVLPRAAVPPPPALA